MESVSPHAFVLGGSGVAGPTLRATISDGMDRSASAGKPPLRSPIGSTSTAAASSSTGTGDQGQAAAGSCFQFVGAGVAVLALANRARRRSEPLHGAVALAAARGRKGKKRGGNSDAVKKALEALNNVEGAANGQPAAMPMPPGAPGAMPMPPGAMPMPPGAPVSAMSMPPQQQHAKENSTKSKRGGRGRGATKSLSELGVKVSEAAEPEKAAADPMPEEKPAIEEQDPAAAEKHTPHEDTVADIQAQIAKATAEGDFDKVASLAAAGQKTIAKEPATEVKEAPASAKEDTLSSAFSGLAELQPRTEPTSINDDPQSLPDVLEMEETPNETEDKKSAGGVFDILSDLELKASSTTISQAAPEEAPAEADTRDIDQMDMFKKEKPKAHTLKDPYARKEGEESFSDDEEEDDDETIRKRRRGEADAVSFEFQPSGLEGEIAVGLKQVSIRMGGRIVLQDASWMVRTGDKLGLVGSNGCGKTTQLRILTGELEADEGTIIKNQDKIRMATLSQGFVDELDLNRTLREELMAAVPRERQIVRDLEQVKTQLESLDSNSEEAEPLITRLTDLQDLAEEWNVYNLDARLDAISNQAGFLPEDLDQIVGLFSGGWKVRIGLCKIFMTNPDVLLLDEPTNHLDLESVEWVEGFLEAQTLPIVVVSHDREFMDRVCNRIVETVEGMTYSYNGNYSEFVKQRDEKMRIWTKRYREQQKEENELVRYIKVSKGIQSLAQAVARKRRQLEQMRASKDYLDPPPRFFRRIKFLFPEPPPVPRGRKIVSTLADMRNVSHGYGDDETSQDSQLLHEANFSVTIGDRIGVVGRNGVGKSTLLRLLMGEEAPSGGGSILKARLPANCYFTQHQADLLPAHLTTYDAVEDANEMGMSQTQILDMMAKFRFKGDRLKVPVAACSGGEKARLAIVRMMLTPSDLLILDEPTNHLDIAMKETLEFSLREFPGAVVVVSHDRYFLSQVCNKIVAIENGKVTKYEGDFRYYMDSDSTLRKQIEGRYSQGTAGIQPLPGTQAELKVKNRSGIKKHQHKRFREARKEAMASMFARRVAPTS